MTAFESDPLPTSSEAAPADVSKLGPTGKRLDYITWHQHHMYMARMLREMSEEEHPAGCYIVDQDHYQIVSGYSGEVKLKDDPCNCAILSAIHKLKRKSYTGDHFVMYITRFPRCNPCLERILEIRISKIWYWSREEDITESDAHFQSFFQDNGIKLEKYVPTRTISFTFQKT